MKNRLLHPEKQPNTQQNVSASRAAYPARNPYPLPPDQHLAAFDAPVQLFRAANLVKSSVTNTSLTGNSGTGEMEGFGATVGAGDGMKTWMTKVTWGGLDANAGEGTRMEAKPVGPDHPSGESSTKSDVHSQARAQFLTHITGQPHIQGHMLNDNMGGPAERRNLSAIPGKPGNSAHEKLVEKPIKALLDARKWVYYRVLVNYQNVQLKALNPAITNAQIPRLKGYDNLPGTVPTTRDSYFRMASSFACEWYTYQPNGERASAVKRVTIKFPHKVYNDAKINSNTYTDNTSGTGYNARFVEFPAITDDESMSVVGEAIANYARHLDMVKDQDNTGASRVPGFPPARIEAIAENKWKDEMENSVIDPSGSHGYRLKYPHTGHNDYEWEYKDMDEKRARGRRYETYIEKYNLTDHWDRYLILLKAELKNKYAQEYKAITDATDQTPSLE